MSDDYDAKLAAWCKAHGVRNPDAGREPEETFLMEDSPMDDGLEEEIRDGRLYLREPGAPDVGCSVSLEDARALLNEVGPWSDWSLWERIMDMPSYRDEIIEEGAS